MDKQIEVIFLPEAELFVIHLDDSARKKLFHSIRKTKSRIFGEWFKKLKGTNDIFEFRISDQGKFIRIFAFWDNRSNIETLILCTHGILKKSNKTPHSEIIKAQNIKKKYFEE